MTVPGGVGVAQVLGGLSLVVLGLVQAAPSVPVSLTPTLNLVAIIGGAVAFGVLVERVRQLERRVGRLEGQGKTQPGG